MSVAISVAAVVVSVVFGYFTALRSQYERVMNVIDFVGCSEVGEARHRLGLIVHESPSMVVADGDRTDRIKDLFVVLWAFGRIDSVRRTLPIWARRGVPWMAGPHSLLSDNTKPWLEYWAKHMAGLAETLGAEIDGSDVGYKALLKAWRVAKH